MSTTLSNAGNATFQGTAPADLVTTVEEARNNQAADGSQAPQGTTPVVVEPGDTISQIMRERGLDWNNPEQRAQFLQDNPQFADRAGGRNPDLIWPGEVVYVRGEGAPPQVGGEPPLNGTHAVSGPDADGNYTYQNYVNGQPSGSQYQAKPGASGQPANSVIIDQNGGEIRTDAQGNPLNGWARVGETAQNGERTYVYYAQGMPTTERQTVAMNAAPPSEPPEPNTGQDMTGNTYGTGWFVTAGSSQGMALHYFVNGYQIDTDQVVNGRTDAPPPIVPPGTNAGLAP